MFHAVVSALLFQLLLLHTNSYVWSGTNNGKSVFHENDIAKEIVVHVPESELPILNFHPNSKATFAGHVYNVNARVQSEKKKLKVALESLNGTVYFFKDILLSGTEDKNSSAFKELLDQASKNLKYDCSHLQLDFDRLSRLSKLYQGPTRHNVNKKLAELYPKLNAEYQEKYKQQVLNNLSAESLVDIVINRPTVVLHLKGWFIGPHFFVVLDSTIELNPFDNLYCLRNQQITTRNGIFLLRHIETEGQQEITKFVFKKIGYLISGELQSGYAVGGDFIPLGNIVFIGRGVKTTKEAIYELMEKNAFGTKEVAVIRSNDFNEFHSPLNLIFNVLDDKNVIILKSVLDNPKNYRYVDLYSMIIGGNRNEKAYGPYRKISSKIELGEFLRSRGFNITTVTDEEQRKFATGFLNIGNGTIVTSYNETSFVKSLNAIGIKVIPINMSDLVGNNVGIHTITQVVARRKLQRK